MESAFGHFPIASDLPFVSEIKKGQFVTKNFILSSGGMLFRVLDRRIGLVIALIFASICLSVHPFLTSVPFYMLSMFVQGIVAAAIDVGANSWILNLWGENCNFYMQALHFCFGLGMSAAPFAIAPFMGLEPAPKNATSNATSVSTEYTLSLEATRSAKVTAKSLQTFQGVFVVASICILVSIAIQCVLFFVENRKLKRIRSKVAMGHHQVMSSMTKDEPVRPQPRRLNYVILIGALLLFVYVGMEVNSVSFVTEYVHFLGYDVETSANQSTILNTAFAIFRFTGIFLSRFLSADTMALIHLSMIAMSSLILLFLSQTSFLCMTIGVFLFGAGCSVIFPCVYSMIEERTPLSNMQVGLLFFSGSIASTIYPLIVPALLEAQPMLFVYNNVVSITIVIGLVLLLIKKAAPIHQT